MSNPYQTPDGPTWSAPPAPSKSQVPMVFGILNILYGLWNLCGVGSGIVGLIMMSKMSSMPGMNQAGPNPVLEMMQNPIFKGISILMIVVTTVLLVLMITSGVGLIQYRMWGCKLSKTWSIAVIVQAIIGIMVNAVFMWIPMFSQMSNAPDGPPGAAAGAIGGVIGGICGSFIGFIYPTVVLIFMSKPQVKSVLT